MSTLRDNTAYDFSRFEPRSAAVRQPQEQKEAKPSVKKPAQAKAAAAAARAVFTPLHAFKWLSILGCFMIALLLMMANNVKLNELDQAVQTQQSQLNAAKSEETTLNMQIESRMSLQKVEDYAVNKLGLHKIDQYQVEYVNLNDKDKAVVAGGNGSLLTAADSLFNRILEYFR